LLDAWALSTVISVQFWPGLSGTRGKHSEPSCRVRFCSRNCVIRSNRALWLCLHCTVANAGTYWPWWRRGPIQLRWASDGLSTTGTWGRALWRGPPPSMIRQAPDRGEAPPAQPTARGSADVGSSVPGARPPGAEQYPGYGFQPGSPSSSGGSGSAGQDGHAMTGPLGDLGGRDAAV
jgi:hypothetical protein